MTDPRSPLPAENGFREFGGPRPCRCRARRPERSAEQFACSPICDCAVQFKGPHRSVLSSVRSDLAVGPVWVTTAVGIFAWSAFYENAAKLKVCGQWRIAVPVLDASLRCTNRR